MVYVNIDGYVTAYLIKINENNRKKAFNSLCFSHEYVSAMGTCQQHDRHVVGSL